jgi:hypothetical protein
MARQSVRVRDAVRATLATFGVQEEIWSAIKTLSTTARVDRCRKALAQLEAVDTTAPGVSMEKSLAQALLATCWIVAVDSELKLQLRAALLEVSAMPDAAEIAIKRAVTIDLVRRTVQGWQ